MKVRLQDFVGRNEKLAPKARNSRYFFFSPSEEKNTNSEKSEVFRAPLAVVAHHVAVSVARVTPKCFVCALVSLANAVLHREHADEHPTTSTFRETIGVRLELLLRSDFRVLVARVALVSVFVGRVGSGVANVTREALLTLCVSTFVAVFATLDRVRAPGRALTAVGATTGFDELWEKAVTARAQRLGGGPAPLSVHANRVHASLCAQITNQKAVVVTVRATFDSATAIFGGTSDCTIRLGCSIAGLALLRRQGRDSVVDLVLSSVECVHGLLFHLCQSELQDFDGQDVNGVGERLFENLSHVQLDVVDGARSGQIVADDVIEGSGHTSESGFRISLG